jgi:glycosyltransferase involved in cell wall biosynthesis
MLMHIKVGGKKSKRVSLCMIVKDEERKITRCLSSVADLVDEIIVVDTGSTDQTKNLAAAIASRVYDFPWKDDFSEARNETLRHARGDWVFSLDADEYFDRDNHESLRGLLLEINEDNSAYMMRIRSPWSSLAGSALMVNHVRLFRNDPRIHWEGRVHEQVLPSIDRLGSHVRLTKIHIEHDGYQNNYIIEQKRLRNLRLLQLEDGENPNNPRTQFYLAWSCYELGWFVRALGLLRKAIVNFQTTNPLFPRLYALLGNVHCQLGQEDEALAACEEGLELCPENAELLLLKAQVLNTRLDFLAAEGALVKALQSTGRGELQGMDELMFTIQVRHELALVYRRQNRINEALAEWGEILQESPDFSPARKALDELYFAHPTH